MQNLYNASDLQATIERIEQLTPATTPQWGKMTVDQMLAHVNVAYDMAFTDKYPKPGFLTRFMLKLFVKQSVVGPKPYKKNTQTAPVFIIKGRRDFAAEKAKLIAHLQQVQELGAEHFEQRESLSFGKLTAQEWNVMFAKHLDHHLTQFGV